MHPRLGTRPGMWRGESDNARGPQRDIFVDVSKSTSPAQRSAQRLNHETHNSMLFNKEGTPLINRGVKSGISRPRQNKDPEISLQSARVGSWQQQDGTQGCCIARARWKHTR